MKPQTILVDMDGVLADFDGAVIRLMAERFPQHPPLRPEERREFYIKNDFPPGLRSHAIACYTEEEGFFRSLQPFDGAVAAVQEMLALGHNVFICTAPIRSNPYCAAEKHAWLVEQFGVEFIGRVIIASDKTMARGDILIDDRPEITGALQPQWEHVLFDRPYNRHVTNRRRLDWSNYRAVLGL